jgi:carbon monoxide dehydrogenase subunit G
MAGSIELRPIGASRTSVTYVGAVKAKGPARQVLNRYFKARIDTDIDEFVRNVRANFEREPNSQTDSGAPRGTAP